MGYLNKNYALSGMVMLNNRFSKWTQTHEWTEKWNNFNLDLLIFVRKKDCQKKNDKREIFIN